MAGMGTEHTACSRKTVTSKRYKAKARKAVGKADRDNEEARAATYRRLKKEANGLRRGSATGRECHAIKDSIDCFGTKLEAETFAIEIAKAWVDARFKAA